MNITRRALLRNSLLLAGLSACSREATPQRSATPRPGGRLRVGIIGAGKSESFNPASASASLIGVARASAVFDSLMSIGPDLALVPGLATAWRHDESVTRWTLTLRPGVTWHDGKPFTADDVIYSLRWMGEDGNMLGNTVANVDLKKLAKRDANTIVITLKEPDLTFPHTLAGSWIIQDGTTDFARPVGTGPFVFDTFTPGQQSVCRRNPKYWQKGRPYIDELLLQSIDDETARVNALLGGQIDVLVQMPFAQAKAYANSGAVRLLNSPSIGAQAFYMAVDQPPFDDVRVRQAMRLLVDRKQLVDVALYGFGSVATDLFGKGLSFYDTGIQQRQRDVAKAKALLAEAGHGAGLSLTLETSPVSPGMVEAAALFAEQAREGGVTIKVTQVDAASYFDPTVQYLKRPFGQTHWSGFSSLSAFYQTAMFPGAAGNETHWSKPEKLQKAMAATDEATAKTAWQEAQREQWEDGGYIWWANVNNVDAVSSRVGGIRPSPYTAMGMPGSLTDAYLIS